MHKRHANSGQVPVFTRRDSSQILAFGIATVLVMTVAAIIYLRS